MNFRLFAALFVPSAISDHRHFGIGESRSPLAAPAVLPAFGERTAPAEPPAVNDADELDEPSWIQLPSSKSTPGKFGSRIGSAPACGVGTPTFDAAPPLDSGAPRFRPPGLPARVLAVLSLNPPVAAPDAPPRALLPPAGSGGCCPPSPPTAPPQARRDEATRNPITTHLLFIRTPRSLLCRLAPKWVNTETARPTCRARAGLGRGLVGVPRSAPGLGRCAQRLGADHQQKSTYASDHDHRLVRRRLVGDFADREASGDRRNLVLRAVLARCAFEARTAGQAIDIATRRRLPLTSPVATKCFPGIDRVFTQSQAVASLVGVRIGWSLGVLPSRRTTWVTASKR